MIVLQIFQILPLFLSDRNRFNIVFQLFIYSIIFSLLKMKKLYLHYVTLLFKE